MMKHYFRNMLVAGCSILCMSSCSSLYHTRYVNSDVKIGMSKEALVAQYGRPYSEEMYEELGTLTEVLSYKETLAQGYMLKTLFYFKDGKLTRKTQEELQPIQPPEVVVKKK